MKKLIILLLILCMSSCTYTDKWRADTYVHCPCIITEIGCIEIADKETSCKIKAISIEDPNEHIKYYVTPYHYKIGDTIP